MPPSTPTQHGRDSHYQHFYYERASRPMHFTRRVLGCRRSTRGVQAYEGVWSKAAIGELHRVDSTIKESMRLRSFGLIGTNRVVSVP